MCAKKQPTKTLGNDWLVHSTTLFGLHCLVEYRLDIDEKGHYVEVNNVYHQGALMNLTDVSFSGQDVYRYIENEISLMLEKDKSTLQHAKKHLLSVLY